MNDDFTRQAIAIALKKMFSGGHFSICTIDECLKLAKITAPPGQYESLRVLHCVDWKDMEPDFRDQVFKRVLALFSDGTTFDLTAIDRGFGLTPMGQLAIVNSSTPNKRRAVGLLSNWRRS